MLSRCFLDFSVGVWAFVIVLSQISSFFSLHEIDVNVANGVAIDVANDVLPVWWREVYPFQFNQ